MKKIMPPSCKEDLMLFGFIGGLFVGVLVGIFTAGLCRMAAVNPRDDLS